MIKFEEHEGKLFLMLDEPVPLTTDAELPCIIAPIQDDSPMGRYVKQCWGHDKLFMREYTICGINADMAANVGVAKDTPISIHMFEIIGTLVKEGSDEWALYQMMRGKKVRHKSYSMPKVHCAMNEKRQIAIFTTPSSMIDGGDIICHANDWLTSRQVDTMTDERTGWQIYKEPKPQYKVGDWVEFNDGVRIGQAIIMRTYDDLYVVKDYLYSMYEFVLNKEYITRKLKPSEIVVRIGCLRGTIAKSCNPNYFLMLHSRPMTDCNHSVIKFSALDKETRELVEGLLKAQKEEEENEKI